MINIVVLIAGRGSNLNALIEQAQSYRIRAVISDKVDASGLDIARAAGIEAISIPRLSGDTLIQHKHTIYAHTEALQPDLWVLAGFMQILEKDFTERHPGRIVNIHPSLLPAFKGLHTHQRALQAYHDSNGLQNRHGCSVHYVDYEVDSGALIAQAACPVYSSDTTDTLAARVLKQEHQLFPWVINRIANQSIHYKQKYVDFSAEAIRESHTLGFQIGTRNQE